MPSRQRARAVQLARAAAQLEAGRRVWSSADVLPAAAWLRREVERCALADPAAWPRLLSAAEEWYLWRACAREATHGLELLDRSALAEALQRSSELAADYRIRLPPAAPESEAALLLETQRVFAARCRAAGAADASSLFERIDTAATAATTAVRLAGFDTVPPRLRTLAAAGTARAEAAAATAPTIVAAADARAECEHIAAWCRERLRRQPDARLLVMLAGAPGVRERLAALIRQALEPRSVLGSAAGGCVGIEAGPALAHVAVVSQALRTLGFLGGEELELDTLGAWLRAPQWARPPAAARARLVLTLRERGLLVFALRDLLGALQLVPAPLRPGARELAAQLGSAAAALAGGSGSARTWSERFAAGLAAAGWPGELAAESAARQTLLRWHELLEDFGGLAGSTGALTRQSALELLRELAGRTPLRPADEDLSVTLAATLADPVVRYDGIWVAGLHAEAFPQPVQPDPFIPLAAQLGAGVPAASAAGRLAQARALLGAWQAGASELVLSAPAQADDLELLPSALLAGAARRGAPRSGWLPAQLRREDQTESLIDTRGLAWPAARALPRGVRSIDLQNLCPFRAYAELRLGATRPEIAEPGVPANRRGEFLHAALQRLWGRLRDSRTLQGLAQAELDELIRASVAEALEDTLARPAARRRRRPAEGQLDMFTTVAPSLAREARRAERLIGKLCELERGRAPFRVTDTERDCELALAGGTLNLRIDRVDALEGGGRAILDYKTGRRTVPDWYAERPTHPQLLAYMCALGEDVAALANVCVNAYQVRFDGIARSAGLLPAVRAARSAALPGAEAWRQWQHAARQLIARLIGAFLAGEAAVDPRPGACDYCHVIDICRISERGGGAPAAETAAESGHD